MTVNKIARNGPEIIHHDESRSGVEEDPFVLLLGLGDPGLRWMFSDPDLLQ